MNLSLAARRLHSIPQLIFRRVFHFHFFSWEWEVVWRCLCLQRGSPVDFSTSRRVSDCSRGPSPPNNRCVAAFARVAREKEGASSSTISHHAVVERSLRSLPMRGMPVSACVVVVDDDRVLFVHFYYCHPVVFLNKYRIVELNSHHFLWFI